MKRIQVSVSEELYELISRCAEVFNMSKSAVCLALLDQTEIKLSMIEASK